MKFWTMRAACAVLTLAILLMLFSCGAKQPPVDEGGSDAGADDTTQQTAAPSLENFDPAAEYAVPDYTSLDMGQYVRLGRYSGLTLTLDGASLTVLDSEVSQYIYEDLKQNHPASKVTDRPVAWGDVVVTDYVGKKDGVAFSGGTAHDQMLEVVEPNGYIPGFIEGLVGVMPGVPTDVAMTFPQDYHATELAGQEVVFTFTVSYIEAVPELTDDFVAEYTQDEYKTVEAYHAAIKAELEQALYEEQLEQQLWSTVIQNAAVVSCPEEPVMYYYSNMYYTYSYYASMYGLDFETYLSYMGATPQDLFDACIQQVKEDMVYRAVINLLGCEYTEQEYDRAVDDYTDMMFDQLNSAIVSNGGSAITWEAANEYFAQNYSEEIKTTLLIEKATQRLLADAKVNVTESGS